MGDCWGSREDVNNASWRVAHLNNSLTSTHAEETHVHAQNDQSPRYRDSANQLSGRASAPPDSCPVRFRCSGQESDPIPRDSSSSTTHPIGFASLESSHANHAAARLRISRSILSRSLFRLSRSNSSRTSVFSPPARRPSSRSACLTQFRIVCSEGAKSCASEAGVRPALTSLTNSSLISGGYRPTMEDTSLLHEAPCSSSADRPASGSRGGPPPAARHVCGDAHKRRRCHSRWPGSAPAVRRHVSRAPREAVSTTRSTRWAKYQALCTSPRPEIPLGGP